MLKTEPSSWTKKAISFLSRGEGSFVIGDAQLFAQAIQTDMAFSALSADLLQIAATSATFVFLHAETLPPSTRRLLRKRLKTVFFLRDSALINSSRSSQLFLQTFYAAVFEALRMFPNTNVTIFTKNMLNTHYILQQLHEAALEFELSAIDECMRISFASNLAS